jgi:hypothetical protein
MRDTRSRLIALHLVSSVLVLSGTAQADPQTDTAPAASRSAPSVSWHGITWTFSAGRTTGEFVNGEPWVR